MSPSNPDSTLLTISRAHLQAKVEIKVGTAALLLSPPPTSPSCYAHLQGGDMCVHSYIHAVLVQCGVRVSALCVSVDGCVLGV